jgi:STE24 endopeptidase
MPRHPIRRFAAATVLCLSVLLGATHGASADQAPDTGMAAPDSTVATAASADTAAMSATDYVEEVRAAFTPENQRYARTGVTLALIAPVYAVLAALLVLFAGWSARMRDIAVRVTRYRYVHTLLYVAMYSVVALLLTLPLAWYSGFHIEHQYGLSNETRTNEFVIAFEFQVAPDGNADNDECKAHNHRRNFSPGDFHSTFQLDLR